MTAVIEYPKPWILPEESPFARRPTRPPIHRQPGFNQQFDSKTIFYDCVCVKDDDAIVLQGPPFFNLKRQLAPKVSIREGDRHAQIWVSAKQPIETLRFSSGIGETELQLSSDCNDFFRGMRVLLTVTQNNQLDWICDWIRFHRDVHGANAVLLYDNSSTAYGLNELMSCLETIPAIDRLCIVSWPFKYGPGGRKGFWDSDFCQYGALENAKWRFLRKAKSVLNCDIDELVVTRGKSVFELAESSGYVTFQGKWIVGVDEESGGSRHRDFRYARAGERCPTKWALVPSKCPKNAQWKVHLIGSMLHTVPASTACYRHFRQINTNWKYDRSPREKFDPARHNVDQELKAAFDKVRWDG
jgi:hypothetical protein